MRGTRPGSVGPDRAGHTVRIELYLTLQSFAFMLSPAERDCCLHKLDSRGGHARCHWYRSQWHHIGAVHIVGRSRENPGNWRCWPASQSLALNASKFDALSARLRSISTLLPLVSTTRPASPSKKQRRSAPIGRRYWGAWSP